jgi:hypothetical protein
MVTKRRLGLLLLLAGGLLLAVTLGVDLVRGGAWTAPGPYQTLGLAAGALLAAVGLSLLPLGGRPA